MVGKPKTGFEEMRAQETFDDASLPRSGHLETHLGQLGINQLRRAAKARHDFLLGP
jgi:hypothetical protein